MGVMGKLETHSNYLIPSVSQSPENIPKFFIRFNRPHSISSPRIHLTIWFVYLGKVTSLSLWVHIIFF